MQSIRHIHSVNCGNTLKPRYDVFMKTSLVLTAILTAIPGFSWSSPSIETLVAEKNYSEATAMARQMPAIRVIEQFSSLAAKNDSPAQWILAESYWRNNQKQEAINWAYAALVGTQLDISGCKDKDKAVQWMMQIYQAIFREARRQPEMQYEGLHFAMNHHADQRSLPNDQEWVCRLNAQLNAKTGRDATITSSKEILMRRREVALMNLAKTSGIEITISQRNR